MRVTAEIESRSVATIKRLNLPRPTGRLANAITAALRWLAILAALIYTAMFFFTALPRVFYPYDLDFIEDGMLMQSLRFAEGRPVFLPPNAEFVPHVYMPLYAWLVGLLFRLTGPGFLPLRLLSLAAVLATTALIFWIACRESRQTWLGLVCAGLFLGGYRITGFWYGLARVDALFMTLALAGLAVGTYSRRSSLGLLLSALLLALAFWTKQTGLLIAAGVGVYLLLVAGRRAWLFGLAFGLLALVPFAGLGLATAGWFWYYTIGIAGSNPVEAGRVVRYLGQELLGVMAGLSGMALGVGLLGLRRAGQHLLLDRPWLLWLGLAAIISGLGRVSVGGNLNNLMPVYTLLCLAPAQLLREWQAHSHLTPRWQTGLVAGLILVQFALGVYNPARYMPTADMRRSGDRLISRIAAVDGEVLVMMHPYYAWLAGKTPSAQLAALWHSRERGSLPLPPDLVARLEQQYYAAIISDNSLFETEPELIRLLETAYFPAETLAADEAPPAPTGMAVQPQVIYRPRPR